MAVFFIYICLVSLLKYVNCLGTVNVLIVELVVSLKSSLSFCFYSAFRQKFQKPLPALRKRHFFLKKISWFW